MSALEEAVRLFNEEGKGAKLTCLEGLSECTSDSNVFAVEVNTGIHLIKDYGEGTKAISIFLPEGSYYELLKILKNLTTG